MGVPEEPCLGVLRWERSMLGLLQLLVSTSSSAFFRKGGVKAFEPDSQGDASLTWGLGQAGLQSEGEQRERRVTHEQLWEAMLLICTSDHSKPILMSGNINSPLRDLPGPTDSSTCPIYVQVYILEEFLLSSVLVAFAIL